MIFRNGVISCCLEFEYFQWEYQAISLFLFCKGGQILLTHFMGFKGIAYISV